MALQPLKTIRHTVNTSWWSGEADIPTYETSELLATNTPTDYDPNTAAAIVMRDLASRLRNAPPAHEIAPLSSRDPSAPRSPSGHIPP